MYKHKWSSFCVLLLVLFALIFKTTGQGIENNFSIDIHGNNIIGDVLTNCVVETVDSNIASKVNQMADDGAKVIYVYFHIQNFTGNLLEEEKASVYKPLSWVRTTGRHGRSLLLLRPQFEIFSLWSLSIGTKRIDVTVTQTPSNCLTNYNATIISEELGEFLLHKFKTPSTNVSIKDDTLMENEHICNLNIADRDGKALFYYVCCHKTSSGQTKCQELKSDKYLAILFVCMFLVNFFAVMFSPLLIPSKLYRKIYETTSYEHKIKSPLTLSIRKTSSKPKGQHVFTIADFKEMETFKNTIEELHSDVTYDVLLSKIYFMTSMDRLLPSNRVPVGLLESLYSALVGCEIRKKPSIKECCNSNMFGPCKPCNHTLPWFKFLRRFMKLVMYILIGKVWIIRLYFFFEYEESERHEKEKAATLRNLALSYTGNLTWYLTPIHISFLVCYCIFLVDLVVFGILSEHVKNTLKHVMRKCLRDMREISRTSAIGWSMQILLHPFKHCGIFGIFFAWLYYIPAIPIVVVTLAFYCLPTINILVRLIIYFIAYLLPYGRNCLTVRWCSKLKQLWNYIHRVFRMDILTRKESIERPEKISMKNRFLQLFVILSCLLTILSFVLLAMECILLVVEVLMYTGIGIIINASNALKYLSLVFLLGFYARDCFSTVTTEYSTFNKFLNSYLVGEMREKVERVSAMNHELQRNTAFQVSLEDSYGDDDKPVSLVIQDKKLKWKINRLILFLDKNDTPYITSKFFFDTCYLQQAGVPGPLLTSLLRAMQRFLLICVFLFFVVVVILAFGEEYGISATNQMFATLAGGFLPYILRFVLFKQPEPVTVDPDNLSFKSKFKRKIEEYTQNWIVSDIRIDSKSTKVNVDSEHNDDVDVANGDEKSKDQAIMLQEITPIIKNDTSDQIDILIYDKFTV
jgi:hypothetical protein